MTSTTRPVRSDRRDSVRALAALRPPSVVVGVGFGGFVDGILFHQVLQLHHMLSNSADDRLGVPTYPVTTLRGLEVNTLWDGLFHATTWVFVLVGVLLLWRAFRRHRPPEPPYRLLVGGMLAGWGIFNLVEGTVSHHILQIHHVYAGELQLLWDLLFLASGAALLAGGWALTRSALDDAGAQR